MPRARPLLLRCPVPLLPCCHASPGAALPCYPAAARARPRCCCGALLPRCCAAPLLGSPACRAARAPRCGEARAPGGRAAVRAWSLRGAGAPGGGEGWVPCGGTPGDAVREMRLRSRGGRASARPCYNLRAASLQRYRVARKLSLRAALLLRRLATRLRGSSAAPLPGRAQAALAAPGGRRVGLRASLLRSPVTR